MCSFKHNDLLFPGPARRCSWTPPAAPSAACRARPTSPPCSRARAGSHRNVTFGRGSGDGWGKLIFPHFPATSLTTQRPPELTLRGRCSAAKGAGRVSFGRRAQSRFDAVFRSWDRTAAGSIDLSCAESMECFVNQTSKGGTPFFPYQPAWLWQHANTCATLMPTLPFRAKSCVRGLQFKIIRCSVRSARFHSCNPVKSHSPSIPSAPLSPPLPASRLARLLAPYPVPLLPEDGYYVFSYHYCYWYYAYDHY